MAAPAATLTRVMMSHRNEEAVGDQFGGQPGGAGLPAPEGTGSVEQEEPPPPTDAPEPPEVAAAPTFTATGGGGANSPRRSSPAPQGRRRVLSTSGSPRSR